MEQEKKKGPGVFGLIALGVVICLSLSLVGDRGRAAAAAAPAALAADRQEPAPVSQEVIAERPAKQRVI